MNTLPQAMDSLSALPATAAVARILEEYRLIIEAKEEGVLEDTDIEALHDFRVAMRRTRTLLKFLGQVFDPESHRRFRKDFSRLAKATGILRDLDVFLSQWEGQMAGLRADPSTLEPIRILLQHRRRSAHRRFLRLLRSPWYRGLQAEWRAFLARAIQEATTGENTRMVADPALKTVFQQVIELGATLRRRGAIERLHELRKDCKELRYLLEALKGFYNNRFDVVVKTLRGLQDNLGEICDLADQQDIVRELRIRLTAAGQVALHPVMLRWVKWLRKRRQRARSHFAERFDRFARKRHRKLFEIID